MKIMNHFEKILITGINGFTGQHLSKHLRSFGAKVFGISGETTVTQDIFQCYIKDKNALKKVIGFIEPDYIVHLAGVPFVGEPDKQLFYNVNVIGTQNLLDAVHECKLKPQKIIIASSATVYGNQNSEILDESMCPFPVEHYGCCKLAMESNIIK